MKKLLALVLALVMSMSLVTISNADFKDADEISYKEAVEVMNAVGVIAGYDNGNFGAKDTLTRAQAAKIVAYLDLGQKVADAISASGTVFTDVPATAWYAGYVEYCAGAGYVAGVGNGKFDPDAKVTGIQLAKMLLGVLGYKADVEGYTGGDYSLNIARDANKVDLFKGLSIVTSAALTREQAAQMAFNALQATCVKYSGGTSVSTSDGTTVTVNANRYEEDDNGDDYKGTANTDKDAYTLQLCEKLYGNDLQKKSDKSDDFGRPATKWEYDKKVVATATEDPIAVYAGADYDKDVTKDLKEDYEDGVSKVYYNGGVDPHVDVAFLEKSINGLTIEVYENPNNEDAMIFVVIEGYVAQIDEINLDDDDEVESVKFTVYEAGRAIDTSKGEFQYTVDVENDEDAYALIEGLEEDEYFVAFLKSGWDTNSKVNSDLLAVDALESIEGEATSISKGTYYSGWVKIDGVKYKFANEYSQATLAKESEGTFYLYNGFVMHFDGEINAAEDEYLFVVRGGKESDKFGATTYYAEVVFADGTSKVVELDDKTTSAPTMGVYSFEVDDDVYKLTTENTTAESVSISKGKTAVGSDTANSKTIYVSVKTKTVDSNKKFDSATVYTGYKTVKSMSGDAYAYVKDGTVELVYIVNATSVASDDDLIYVAKKSVSGKIEDKDLADHYTYNAVVGGEIVEIMATSNTLDGLYDTSTTDDDGIYTELKDSTITASSSTSTLGTTATSTSFKKAENEVVKVGSTALAYADDVNVFVIDTDGDITTGSINRNYSNVNVTYTVNDDGEVTNFYIVKLA